MQTKRNFTRGLIAALPPAFGWAGGADGAAPAKGTGAGGAGIENVIAAFCVPVGAIEMAAAGTEGNILLLVQFFRHKSPPFATFFRLFFGDALCIGSANPALPPL